MMSFIFYKKIKLLMPVRYNIILFTLILCKNVYVMYLLKKKKKKR